MDNKWLDPSFSFPSNSHGSSTGMNDPFDADFDMEGMVLDQNSDFKFENMSQNFGVDNDQNDSLVFDNNGQGGRGNLSYDQQPFHDQNESQSFSAPAGLNNHQSFAAPVGLDGPSSYQNSNEDQDSLITPANGGVEQATGSVETDKALVKKKGAYNKKQAALGPLRDDQQDSDDDYNSNAEEDEEDDEVDGKKRRKSYAEPRILTRWNTGQDQLLLLALKYECDLRNMELPWAAAYLHVNADGKPDAVHQHFTKVRKARIYYGIHVPPPSGKENGKEKVEGPSVQHEEKEIRNFATLVYTKPGTDEDANGPPGTHEPVYTPKQIKIKPQLPYYGKPGWPLSLEEADKVMADLGTRGARWSTDVEHTVEVQDAEYARSSKKKGKSTKPIKVEQADEDAYVLKPTRKAQSTPTASQKKKAQTSTPKSAGKGSPMKSKGVAKSKKASTPLGKAKVKALVEKTPMSLLSEELAAAQVKTPAKTPSRKATAATSKKSTSTKKKGKTAKATTTPPSEEETLTEPPPTPNSHTELSAGKYGRKEEDIRIEPAETWHESMSKLPSSDFGIARNSGRQDLGSQAHANGTPVQGMHHQGDQSFGPQSAMSNMPSQSMQHQSDSTNNMTQYHMPNVSSMPSMPNQSMQHQNGFVNNTSQFGMAGAPDQLMQYQGGQGFGPQPAMAHGSGPSMQNQGSYNYNGYSQQMPSGPMYHHGQHMAAQIPEQQWQMQTGQNSMMNNNNNMVYSAENNRLLQVLSSMIQQPTVLQQFTNNQGFPGFGMDTGPMVRAPLAGYEDEMAGYIHSSGPSTTESPHQPSSFVSNKTHHSSVSTNDVDSKPQTMEKATEAMAGSMAGEFDQNEFGLFGQNDKH